MLKFMKKRNFLALVLALALTLGLAAPAGAATEGTEVQNGAASVEVEVVMNLPTIQVTIGNPPEIIVNPYKLNYRVDDGTLGVDQKTIVSAPVLITSTSAIDLDVEAKPTGTSTGSGAVSFATAPVADGSTTKEVFLYLELADASSNTGTFGASWAASYADDNTKQALVTTGGSKTAKITLPKPTTFNGSSYCAFKLDGNCAGSEAKWVGGASGDNITVSVAFTFTPKATTVTPGP